MRFTSSASVALVASLAALEEASYPFHARSGKFLHHARGFNSTADDGVSSVFVIPTPAEKTPQVTPSIPLSTGAAREIDPEAAVSTQTSVEDLTLTYTLGGASTTVVTTTVQRTATNTVVVTQVCFFYILGVMLSRAEPNFIYRPLRPVSPRRQSLMTSPPPLSPPPLLPPPLLPSILLLAPPSSVDLTPPDPAMASLSLSLRRRPSQW